MDEAMVMVGRRSFQMRAAAYCYIVVSLKWSSAVMYLYSKYYAVLTVHLTCGVAY